MTIQLDLENSANWQSFYTQSYNVQTTASGYYPIPKTVLPVLASTPVLHVSTSSSDVGRNWNTGGWLTPLFDNAIALARHNSFWLPLNGSRLVVLAGDYASTYQLQFSTPQWMRSITLTIFEYTGAIGDTTDAQLTAIQAQLEQIQSLISL